MSIYRDDEACEYIWDSLWCSDQKYFLEFNILDIIQVFVGGEISRWLFTSADGLVKSKSKSRWNTDAIKDRCIGNNSNGKIHANISVTCKELEWNSVNEYDEIEDTFKTDSNNILKTDGNNKTSIVIYGHLSGKANYLETIYEIENDILQPKCKTFLYCDSKAKGYLLESDKNMIPSGRIKCLNKIMNENTKKAITDLVHLVESRRNVQILKLVVIFVSENDEDFQNNQKKVLWLHHTKDLIITSKKHKNNNSDGSVFNESVSEWTENKSTVCSINHATNSVYRKAKCMGDFCKYSEIVETKYIELYGEDYTSAIKESKKAIKRHKSEMKEDEDFDVLNSSDMGDITSHNKSRVGTSSSCVGSSNSKNNGDDDEEENKGIGFPDDVFNIDSQPSIMTASSIKYIALKSILLARKDMQDFDSIEDKDDKNNSNLSHSLWPEKLLHWWHRVGKFPSIKHRNNNNINTKINNGFESPIEKKESNLTENFIYSHNNLTYNNDNMSLASTNTNVHQIPYDMNGINSYSGKRRKNLGEINSYYSDAKVCERCYSAYRDIDNKRKEIKKKQICTQSLLSTNSELHKINEREIEKRKFSQKSFASRMSAITIKKIENSENISSYSTFSTNGNNIDGSSSVYSVLTTDDYHASGRSSRAGTGHSRSIESRAQSKSYLLRVGASPKRSLLPLGHLRDGEKLQTYDHMSNSFKRDITSSTNKNSNNSSNNNSNNSSSNNIFKNYNNHNEVDDSEIQNQWELMTKRRVMSEGGNVNKEKGMKNMRSIQSSNGKIREVNGYIKDFDSKRLMHKHQRELYDMRAESVMNESSSSYRSEDSSTSSIGTNNNRSRIIVVKKGEKNKSANNRNNNYGIHNNNYHSKHNNNFNLNSNDDNSNHYNNNSNNNNVYQQNNYINNKNNNDPHNVINYSNYDSNNHGNRNNNNYGYHNRSGMNSRNSDNDNSRNSTITNKDNSTNNNDTNNNNNHYHDDNEKIMDENSNNRSSDNIFSDSSLKPILDNTNSNHGKMPKKVVSFIESKNSTNTDINTNMNTNTNINISRNTNTENLNSLTIEDKLSVEKKEALNSTNTPISNYLAGLYNYNNRYSNYLKPSVSNNNVNNNDSEEEDDEEEGIAWSPFVIPSIN